MSASSRTETDPSDSRSRLRRVPWKKVLLYGVGGGFLLVVLGVGIAYARTDVPTANEVSTNQATVFRYSDGSEMASLGVNRVDVPLSDVPEAVQKAVLSAEDRNYYEEPGISPTGIVRAAIANVRGGGISQGASTITQQYAKNAYLTQERTFSRKFREIFIAVKLDRTRSKDQILEDYLNTVYFGRGALGIEVAAKTYFGVSARDLTADQGIVLAALLRGPALYDPADHPERAQDRYDYVYDGMVENGWLPEGTPETVPAVLPIAETSDRLAGPTGYLVRHAEKELAAQGYTEDYVRTAGLDVTTTIDRAKQEAAAAAVAEVYGDLPEGLLAPLVAIEPATGRIVAEYAGEDYNADQFNAVTDAVAQAGSTFKPYVLAAALKEGVSLTSRWDGSSPLARPGYGEDDEVENYGNTDEGTNLTLIEATALSTNTVFVPLGAEAGLDNVAETAVALGIRESDIDQDSLGESMYLGSASVHPIDQAVAYAALANHGERPTPHIIDTVRTLDGQVLAEIRTRTTSALDAEIADQTTFALQAVLAPGGTAAGAALDGRPAAGKTGTTNDSTAAWFAGYTPQLTAVAAVFYRDDNRPVTGIAGIEGEITGGAGPARVWKAFMDAALAGEPVEQFAEVTLDRDAPTIAPPTVSAPPSESPSASPTPSETPSEEPSSEAPEPSVLPSLPPVTARPSASPSAEPEPSSAPADPQPSASTAPASQVSSAAAASPGG